jgi:hypothetical protein
LIYLPTDLSPGAFHAISLPVPGDTAGVTLFSTVDVFDGDSISSYSALAGLAAFVAVLALIGWLLLQNSNEQNEKPLALFAGAASGVACFLFVVLYLSRWGGYHDCVRYAVPFLLGSCVVPTLMAPSLLGKLPRALCILLPSIGRVFLVTLFVPAAVARGRRAVHYGSIFQFGMVTTADYRSYIQFSLSNEAHTQIAKYQDAVPASQPLFAWINTPYWLDYRRNPIVDVDTAGTATPWAHLPTNVHYFLWQYSGYATRREEDYKVRMHSPGVGARERVIAERSLDLANSLTKLADRGQVISKNNEYILFEFFDN